MYGVKRGWFEAFDGDVWPWLYLNHKDRSRRKLTPDAWPRARATGIAGRGYIEAAYTRRTGGRAVPADQPLMKSAALAYRPDRCGDVIAVPKPGVLVTKYKEGVSHGSPHAYDAHVPFLVYGSGVPALGERKERVSSLAVAPGAGVGAGRAAPAGATEKPPACLKQ
jgi:hypothetical protein